MNKDWKQRLGKTRRVLSALVSLIGVFFCLVSCDETFSPKAEYKPQLVIYAVLDRSKPFQTVRLSRMYDHDLTQPYTSNEAAPIDSAEVIVTSGGLKFVFKDTLVDIGGVLQKVWISRNLIPQENRSYVLSVNAPGFPRLTAQTTVPTRAYVKIEPKYSITTGKIDTVIVTAGTKTFSVPPSGFYPRLWMHYIDTVAGAPIDMRLEVPTRIDPSTGQPYYPKPGKTETVSFGRMTITATLKKLTDSPGWRRVDFVGYLYHTDAPFINYYKIVRGFDDPNSVRLDLPDYTNVTGGRGVFGAVVADSVRYRMLQIFEPKP